MKVKAIEVLKAFPVLQKLAQERIPLLAAVCLSRQVKKLHPEWTILEAQRGAKVEELGVRDEKDQTQFRLTPEAQQAYLKFFVELSEIDLEVEVPVLCASTLGKTEITAANLLDLGPFIDTTSLEG